MRTEKEGGQKTYYRGWWKHNRVNGQVSINYGNGSSYFGACKRMLKHGFGEYREEHGEKVYLGHFHEDKRHGSGSQV